MATLDISDILDEIVVTLKNQDVISTTTRGVTTGSETFSGDGSTLTYTLSNDIVRNVRTITIGGTAQSFGTDYSVDYNSSSSTITFTSAPTNGSDNISVSYDYKASGGDKIYPDYVRADLSNSSFPRVSVSYMGAESTPLGLGASGVMTSPVVSISAYDRDEKDVNDYIDSIRSAILTNKKSFYTFKCILPINTNPMMVFDRGKGDEVLYRTADFRIYLEKES